MKTIVSLALAGLMSISALLPALAAQETENVSIPESSGISESMEQDESSVSGSGSTADESSAPESGSNAEDGSVLSSGVTAATADEQSVSVTVSEEYAILLATNQADSMMGHAGMERSDACTQPAASFVLADYAAETEDESYCLLWEAMNAAFEQLGAQGYLAARCAYADGTLMVYV